MPSQIRVDICKCEAGTLSSRVKRYTEGTEIRKILDYIGVDSGPPQVSSARGPPLWDDCIDAQTDDSGGGGHIEPDWHLAAQPAPDFEVDQRIN